MHVLEIIEPKPGRKGQPISPFGPFVLHLFHIKAFQTKTLFCKCQKRNRNKWLPLPLSLPHRGLRARRGPTGYTTPALLPSPQQREVHTEGYTKETTIVDAIWGAILVLGPQLVHGTGGHWHIPVRSQRLFSG